MNDLDKLKDMELCVFNVCKCFIFRFLMQKVKHLFVVINIWRIGKVTWYIQCRVIFFDQFNTIIHLLNAIYCVYIVKNHKTTIPIHQIIRLSILLCVGDIFSYSFCVCVSFFYFCLCALFFYSYYKLLSLI